MNMTALSAKTGRDEPTGAASSLPQRPWGQMLSRPIQEEGMNDEFYLLNRVQVVGSL